MEEIVANEHESSQCEGMTEMQRVLEFVSCHEFERTASRQFRHFACSGGGSSGLLHSRRVLLLGRAVAAQRRLERMEGSRGRHGGRSSSSSGSGRTGVSGGAADRSGQRGNGAWRRHVRVQSGTDAWDCRRGGCRDRLGSGASTGHGRGGGRRLDRDS